ncbi:hypothetical protein [Treponema sp. R80B11-R83G3]
MKKIFTMIAIFTLILAACDNGDSSGNGNGDGTTLTIRNVSDYDFKNVVYGSTTFGAIASGASQTKGVAANTSKPISFFLNLNYIYDGYGVQCQTAALACDSGNNREITIDNSTTVTTNDGSDTLEDIAYMMEAESGKH